MALLLIEFRTLQRIEQVYEKLRQTRFRDISSDPDILDKWAQLGLTQHDKPYLLRLGDGKWHGEMELVFRNTRLV